LINSEIEVSFKTPNTKSYYIFKGDFCHMSCHEKTISMLLALMASCFLFTICTVYCVLFTVYCLLLTVVGWKNEHSSLIGDWQAPRLTQALLCLHVLLDSNAVDFKPQTCSKRKTKRYH